MRKKSINTIQKQKYIKINNVRTAQNKRREHKSIKIASETYMKRHQLITLPKQLYEKKSYKNMSKSNIYENK